MDLIAAEYWCPTCGEENVLSVDPSEGGRQEHVVDCTVCCRPAVLKVRVAGDGHSASVTAETEQDPD